MQAYPRQKGLPRPYNLQFKAAKQQYPIHKYLNTPLKRVLSYLIVLIVLGYLIYVGTSSTRLKEENLTHNLDNEKLELLKANKLAANLEGDMKAKDDKSELEEKSILLDNKESNMANIIDKVDRLKEVPFKKPPPKILQPASAVI